MVARLHRPEEAHEPHDGIEQEEIHLLQPLEDPISEIIHIIHLLVRVGVVELLLVYRVVHRMKGVVGLFASRPEVLRLVTRLELPVDETVTDAR